MLLLLLQTPGEATLPNDIYQQLSAHGAERRAKQRIEEPFPALVRGVDAAGEKFEAETVLDNIGAGGLYLRLRQRLEPGTTLFIISRLSTAKETEVDAPRLALHGVVLRAELKPGGFCGVAIALSHHRFL